MSSINTQNAYVQILHHVYIAWLWLNFKSRALRKQMNSKKQNKTQSNKQWGRSPAHLTSTHSETSWKKLMLYKMANGTHLMCEPNARLGFIKHTIFYYGIWAKCVGARDAPNAINQQKSKIGTGSLPKRVTLATAAPLTFAKNLKIDATSVRSARVSVRHVISEMRWLVMWTGVRERQRAARRDGDRPRMCVATPPLPVAPNTNGKDGVRSGTKWRRSGE